MPSDRVAQDAAVIVCMLKKIISIEIFYFSLGNNIEKTN